MLGKWLPGLFGSKGDGVVSTDLRVGDATQIEGNLPVINPRSLHIASLHYSTAGFG